MVGHLNFFIDRIKSAAVKTGSRETKQLDRDSPGIRTHERSSGGQFPFNSCPTKSQSFPFGELHEGDTSQACCATSRIDWNVGAEKGWTYGTITTVILPGLKLSKSTGLHGVLNLGNP